MDTLLHTSNLYYSKPAAEAAEKLTRAAQMDRVFFTNSGTEAIEGALKAARKYAFTEALAAMSLSPWNTPSTGARWAQWL